MLRALNALQRLMDANESKHPIPVDPKSLQAQAQQIWAGLKHSSNSAGFLGADEVMSLVARPT